MKTCTLFCLCVKRPFDLWRTPVLGSFILNIALTADNECPSHNNDEPNKSKTINVFISLVFSESSSPESTAQSSHFPDLLFLPYEAHEKTNGATPFWNHCYNERKTQLHTGLGVNGNALQSGKAQSQPCNQVSSYCHWWQQRHSWNGAPNSWLTDWVAVTQSQLVCLSLRCTSTQFIVEQKKKNPCHYITIRTSGLNEILTGVGHCITSWEIKFLGWLAVCPSPNVYRQAA